MKAHIKNVLQEFPYWNPNALNIAYDEFIILLKELKHLDKQLLHTTEFNKVLKSIKSKINHPIAAVGAFSSANTNHRPEFFRFISAIELLLVDLPDSIGDQLDLRSEKESRILYSYAIAIYKRGISLNNDKYIIPIFIIEILSKLHIRTKGYLEELLSVAETSSPKIHNRYLLSAAQIATYYGWCVEIMHLRNPIIQNRSAKLLLETIENSGYYPTIPGWIKETPMIFAFSFGSPMGIFGLTYDIAEKESSINRLHIIEQFYQLYIPLLHVFLDDFIDIEEDIEIQMDLNLILIISQNDKINVKVILLFLNNLRTSIRKEKEQLVKGLGKEGSKPHIHAVNNMIQYYLVRLYNTRELNTDIKEALERLYL